MILGENDRAVDVLNDLVGVERWGPFAVPGGEDFQALDAGEIMKTNPLRWAMKVAREDEGFALRVQPLTADIVGEFLLEALAAQALLAMPMDFDMALPLETVGRIVTVDFDPHVPEPPPPAEPPATRNPRYADGDPPIPMLFLVGLDGKVERAYYREVCAFLRSGKAGEQMDLVLQAVMAGQVSRPEAFYFLMKVQSLLTGAYKQRYSLLGEVIPAAMGRIVG